MKITVVVNCYNSKKYIAETAQSLSSQTYSNFKVLFVDNHSTDDSFATFKANANFEINYIKTPKFISLYSARNYAISFLDTPLICFLDADDLWTPNYLQTINDFHQKYPLIIGCQASTISHKNGKNLKEVTKNLKDINFIKVSDFGKISFPPLGGISIKKEFFKNYKFPEPSNFIGDLDLSVTLSEKKQLFFFNETKFFYRIHSGGLTSSNLEGWENELGEWLDSKKLNLPIQLFNKLENDRKYLAYRLLINKINLQKFLIVVLKSSIPFYYKMKLMFRKVLNK